MAFLLCFLGWLSISVERNQAKGVLWKRLNTETSQRGNASKTGFEEFPFFGGEIPQNWKMLRHFRIFLRRFLIFKVEVFPLFLRRFRFFGAFQFFQKTFKTLFCWGVSSFFWGVSVFWKKIILLRRFRFFWGVSVFWKNF